MGGEILMAHVLAKEDIVDLLDLGFICEVFDLLHVWHQGVEVLLLPELGLLF